MRIDSVEDIDIDARSSTDGLNYAGARGASLRNGGTSAMAIEMIDNPSSRDGDAWKSAKAGVDEEMGPFTNSVGDDDASSEDNESGSDATHLEQAHSNYGFKALKEEEDDDNAIGGLFAAFKACSAAMNGCVYSLYDGVQQLQRAKRRKV